MEFMTTVMLNDKTLSWKIQITSFERTGWNSLTYGTVRWIPSTRKLKVLPNEEGLKELKTQSPEVFTGGLGRCKKITAKFELKENVQPVFKKKRNVSFASLKQIDDQLDRLEKKWVLSKENIAVGLHQPFI